jgi:hypothetical protein
VLQQLHLTELCCKCWVHTRVHTAALLRLIIGERETNSNAGSARVRLFFDLFDLIYLFVCFFPRIFSPVVKRDKVTRRETTVCLSRVGKFEQSASERRGWFTWKVDVRWCRRFVPFTPPPSTCKGAGLGGFSFSFPAFSSYCLCFARLDRWLPSGLFCMSNQVESASIDTTELVTMNQTVQCGSYGLFTVAKSHSSARV